MADKVKAPQTIKTEKAELFAPKDHMNESLQSETLSYDARADTLI